MSSTIAFPIFTLTGGAIEEQEDIEPNPSASNANLHSVNLTAMMPSISTGHQAGGNDGHDPFAPIGTQFPIFTSPPLRNPCDEAECDVNETCHIVDGEVRIFGVQKFVSSSG